MAQPLECSGPLIPPVYSQADPSQPIELGNTVVQFSHRRQTFRKTAKATIQFLPKSQLMFVVPAEDTIEDKLWSLEVVQDLVTQHGAELLLVDRDVSLEAYCAGLREEGIAFIPKRALIALTPRPKAVSAVVFHLLNFPDFSGTEDYILTSHGLRWCGRAILKSGGWKVTIAATDRTADLVKSLNRQGGHVITHMGKIERDDGSKFPMEPVEQLLYCVAQFLSFALGRRTGPALPVGLDDDGSRVFEQWDLPSIARNAWHGSCSWFDDRHGQLFSEVFPGFCTLWNDPSWKEHIRVALFWYLSANEHGSGINVDAGTILAQAALERLAWAQCVEQARIVSAKEFSRRFSAARRLRLLASTLNIPTALPQAMIALNAKQKKKWSDLPEAITSIRNALVHPSEGESPPKGSHYQAWRTSMWFLDLVLLRLCGHMGDYANRLTDGRWAGTVEPVPWAKQSVSGKGTD